MRLWPSRGVEARLIAFLIAAVLAIGAAVGTVATYIASRNHAITRAEADRRQERALVELTGAVDAELDAASASPALRTSTDSRLARLGDPSVRAAIQSVLAGWRDHRGDPQRREALRRRLDDEQAVLWRAGDAAERGVDHAVHEVTVSVLVSLGVVALLLIVAVMRLRSWTALPLRSLTRSVTALGDGDLTTPIDGTGPDDFSQLGRAIDDLRRTLLAQAERSIAAEEALAQGPPVLESLRRQLLPSSATPDLPGTSIGVASRPAEGVVAGDWCDVMALDGGLIGLVIGDVSGHGGDPGLVALQAKLLITAGLHRGLDPARAIGWTQDQLIIADETIVTCWVGILNPETLSLRYANAGHPPGWHRHPDGTVAELITNGPLISALSGRWATQEDRLEPGSLLLLLTDGVLEARNALDEELGPDGVLHVLALAHEADPPMPVDELGEEILLAARRHGADRLRDDATVLAVRLDDQVSAV